MYLGSKEIYCIFKTCCVISVLCPTRWCFLEVCHPRCVCENWKGYVVKHNYINEGVFNGYTRQLHVLAFTGHLQVGFKRT